MAERVEELYRRFGQVIYARCKKLLRDGAAAEDATQEVFLRVMKHIEEVPEATAALRFIYRVSTNYCLTQIRNRNKRALLNELLDRPAASMPCDLSDQRLVERLLMAMPRRLWEPAVLHYVDGMEQEEVGAVLGVSRRTVINRLNDFKERAQRLLAIGAAHG